MFTRSLRSLIFIIVIAFMTLSAELVPRVASAQSTFGTFTGTITDQSGAVIPGATITVTSTATGAQRTTVTAVSGDFQLVNLDAGIYRVTAHLDGFGDATRDVELLARQIVRVNLQLLVAGATEQVEVTAVRPVVETERAAIESSRSGDDINKLALNFRATNNTSPIVVATLSQGVQQDRAGNISVAGALPFMTQFSVDGISTQRIRYGGPSRELFPSVESIEEFKVASASNSAEFMQVTDLHDDHQERIEPDARHRLLVQSEQRAQRDLAVHASRRSGRRHQAGRPDEQLRSIGRWADCQKSRVLLRHL